METITSTSEITSYQTIIYGPSLSSTILTRGHACSVPAKNEIFDDVGTKLYKCFVLHLYNVGLTSKTLARRCVNVIQMFCLLGCDQYILTSQFDFPINQC